METPNQPLPEASYFNKLMLALATLPPKEREHFSHDFVEDVRKQHPANPFAAEQRGGELNEQEAFRNAALSLFGDRFGPLLENMTGLDAPSKIQCLNQFIEEIEENAAVFTREEIYVLAKKAKDEQLTTFMLYKSLLALYEYFSKVDAEEQRYFIEDFRRLLEDGPSWDEILESTAFVEALNGIDPYIREMKARNLLKNSVEHSLSES